MTFQTDIRLRETTCTYARIPARSPLKFGGVVVESAIIARVKVTVENRKGEVSTGIGEMSLADAWGWPSQKVPHDQRETIMQAVTDHACELFRQTQRFAHPIELCIQVERDLLKLLPLACKNVPELMPKLCALICLSAPDAAMHDAFGRVNGFDTYAHGYGPGAMRDLRFFLSAYGNFSDKYIQNYLRPAYAPELPVFHLIGGLDKLSPEEVTKDDPQDGRPNCLLDWIRADGLFCLKVKWRGNDIEWDYKRAREIWKVVKQANSTPHPGLAALARPSPSRGEGTAERASPTYLTGDTNEMCDSPDYMIELLNRLRADEPEFFDALMYVEQPTHRDLWNHPHDFHKLAAIKPVIMDESLTDIEVLERGLELGVSGIALKTCKTQSLALLTLAYAAEKQLPYSVQDLSLAGTALLQSVGLAARGNTILGVEANGRQFFPAGNSAELLAVHSDALLVKNGVCKTASLKGPGLGYTHIESA